MPAIPTATTTAAIPTASVTSAPMTSVTKRFVMATVMPTVV
jgi:hypothetical protein